MITTIKHRVRQGQEGNHYACDASLSIVLLLFIYLYLWVTMLRYGHESIIFFRVLIYSFNMSLLTRA